eukprot:764240-Hanusia_phi.AAC.12
MILVTGRSRCGDGSSPVQPPFNLAKLSVTSQITEGPRQVIRLRQFEEFSTRLSLGSTPGCPAVSRWPGPQELMIAAAVPVQCPPGRASESDPGAGSLPAVRPGPRANWRGGYIDGLRIFEVSPSNDPKRTLMFQERDGFAALAPWIRFCTRIIFL